MLRGTFDQLKAHLSGALLMIWGQSKVPLWRKKLKESACAAWVRPLLVGVCNCAWPYTCKAMRYLTWKQELCQPLAWLAPRWPFAVHLAWPVSSCTSAPSHGASLLASQIWMPFQHACCTCNNIHAFWCTDVLHYWWVRFHTVKQKGK